MSARSLVARLNWFLVRTPYRYMVKGAQRLRASRAIRARRSVYQGFSLDAAQQQALESLRRYGYADANAVVERSRLEAAYATAQRKVREESLTETVRLNPDKDFWERLLDEDLDDEGRQRSDSPFVQVAIDERVLQVVSAYLGDAPLLDYVFLMHSTHRPGPLKVSQLWHKDYDDTCVLKLFVYFTDCERDEDGPFTFLPADISQKVRFAMHSHRPDEDLGVANLDQHATAMKAPKLSAFFVDTSRCYHMGSRVAPGHERLLYMGSFATFPKYTGKPTNRFAISSPVSELQRVALTYA